MELKPAMLIAQDAPQEILSAAKPYEARFKVKFTHYYIFSAPLLQHLHNLAHHVFDSRTCFIASKADDSIFPLIEELTEIANITQLTFDHRTRYFRSLLSLYHKLARATDSFEKPQSLQVCPEREGRILASALGWLGRHFQTPHAKRIPYRGGLIVGLSGLDGNRWYESCNIIDGAIASGSTIISIMERLRRNVGMFHIYSVHAAIEGLCALFLYAAGTGISLRTTVAHATEGLNKKYYAILREDASRVVVGDLGDTIADLSAGGGV